jgi:hypothetical protein
VRIEYAIPFLRQDIRVIDEDDARLIAASFVRHGGKVFDELLKAGYLLEVSALLEIGETRRTLSDVPMTRTKSILVRISYEDSAAMVSAWSGG